jgi:hypothetical protein
MREMAFSKLCLNHAQYFHRQEEIARKESIVAQYTKERECPGARSTSKNFAYFSF